MRLVPTLSLIAAAALAGCASHGGGAAAKAPADPAATRVKAAVATLSPAASGGAMGLVSFALTDTGVDVHVSASGLAPGSVHGFHVHEKGNCASADFTSAGGHFNPENHQHGPQTGEHHMGDMPNLLADPQGNIDSRFSIAGVTLSGANGIVGRAVIVHAGPDDYATQPTGNSGGRIACGVIAAQ
jgi:Cu-Zn family superoxide dismutase